jgi:FKBP-type peptidyl-prolyl cis-trans isomerase (trigger factor)
MSEFKIKQSFNKETSLEEIEIIIPKENFEKYSQIALEEIAKNYSTKGFRKGKVPHKIVLANKYNEISDRALEIAVGEAIKSIGELKPQQLEPLTIKSIDKVENSDDFKLLVTYLPKPEVKLPDLSKIKVNEVKAKTTDKEEVAKEIERIWFAYAKKIDPEVKKEDYKKELLDADFFEKSGLKKENPELDSVEKLEKFIEDYINQTYIRSAQIDWEELVKTELINKSEYEKLDALVNRELERKVESYMNKFKEIGMNAEDYIKEAKIDLEQLKKEWREQSERDIKFELILQEYGNTNKIQPSEEEIEAEIAKLDPNTRKSYSKEPEKLRSLIIYYFINNKSYENIYNQIRENSKK